MPSPLATRFAALADVHGNVDALRAVLADIDAQGIDTLVNLGDHFSGPLAAAETAQVLADRPMVSLRSNHDRWLCERAPAEMGPSDAAAYAELRAEDLDWLRTLPPHAFVADDVFACHATPTDDLTYWLETVSGDGVVGPRSLHEVASFARGVPASLFLCAHTHIPRRVDLPDGRVILNPGSVGWLVSELVV
jgi:predicted phosphodiesterase